MCCVCDHVAVLTSVVSPVVGLTSVVVSLTLVVSLTSVVSPVVSTTSVVSVAFLQSISQ